MVKKWKQRKLKNLLKNIEKRQDYVFKEENIPRYLRKNHDSVYKRRKFTLQKKCYDYLISIGD